MKIECLKVWTANHFKRNKSKLLFDIRISVRKFSTIGDEINAMCVLKGAGGDNHTVNRSYFEII